MATLEDTKIEDFSHTDEIHALPDIDSVIYQKANAVCSIGADAVSEEVKKLSIRAKPKKERVNDSVAVRRDFFCAFSAFPASSPSVPNKSARIRDFFLRFSSLYSCLCRCL